MRVLIFFLSVLALNAYQSGNFSTLIEQMNNLNEENLRIWEVCKDIKYKEIMKFSLSNGKMNFVLQEKTWNFNQIFNEVDNVFLSNFPEDSYFDLSPIINKFSELHPIHAYNKTNTLLTAISKTKEILRYKCEDNLFNFLFYVSERKDVLMREKDENLNQPKLDLSFTNNEKNVHQSLKKLYLMLKFVSENYIWIFSSNLSEKLEPFSRGNLILYENENPVAYQGVQIFFRSNIDLIKIVKIKEVHVNCSVDGELKMYILNKHNKIIGRHTLTIQDNENFNLKKFTGLNENVDGRITFLFGYTGKAGFGKRNSQTKQFYDIDGDLFLKNEYVKKFNLAGNEENLSDLIEGTNVALDIRVIYSKEVVPLIF